MYNDARVPFFQIIVLTLMYSRKKITEKEKKYNKASKIFDYFFLSLHALDYVFFPQYK